MIALFLKTFSSPQHANHDMKWSEYNESLVRQGDEILLGFDVINNWDKELEEMNKGKVVEQIHHSHIFLLLLYQLT